MWIKSRRLGFYQSFRCLNISAYEERGANKTGMDGDKCAECVVSVPEEPVAGCVRPLLLMLECKSYDINPARYD